MHFPYSHILKFSCQNVVSWIPYPFLNIQYPSWIDIKTKIHWLFFKYSSKVSLIIISSWSHVIRLGFLLFCWLCLYVRKIFLFIWNAVTICITELLLCHKFFCGMLGKKHFVPFCLSYKRAFLFFNFVNNNYAKTIKSVVVITCHFWHLANIRKLLCCYTHIWLS